ncbi:hypothetical protein Clacol_008246 [Clathrus columnatus]|uniref:D-arabinono-1,4-lactone oxidase n=1 Tax=Clathrus columnatus TaxID=1419009 RepID=A0AAV5AMP5_9AGAM|nr:hypothetical protein Clacol_008246 [Clathrus columnatus]
MFPLTRCVGNNFQGHPGCGRDFPRKAVPGLCGVCFEYGSHSQNQPQCKLCGCASSLRYRIRKSKCDDCRAFLAREKWAWNLDGGDQSLVLPNIGIEQESRKDGIKTEFNYLVYGHASTQLSALSVDPASRKLLSTSTMPPIELDFSSFTTEQLYDYLKPVTLSSHSQRARFVNWGLAFACNPLLVFEPTNDQQCIAIVYLARKEGVGVRAAGAGHSPSDMACTNDFMIRTLKLDSLLNVDLNNGRVTVQGGMTLSTLHKHLEQHDLALTSVGSISDQTIAGIITTATHGSGLSYPSMSSLVHSFTILLANGHVISCSRQEDEDLFLATLCGFGTTGFILNVTFQCEKRFRLREEAENVDFHDFVNHFEEIASSAQHVRCWWFAQRGVVRVSKCNRTDEPLKRAASWFRQVLLAHHVVQFTLFLGRIWPIWNAWSAIFASWLMKEKAVGVGESWRVFNVDCRYPQHTIEFALPISVVPQCLFALSKYIQEELGRSDGIRPHFPFEIRFSEEDDVWLSPAYQRRTCWIGIAQYKPYGLSIPFKTYFAHVSHILHAFGGRPHWAKEQPFRPTELGKMYPRWTDFNVVRRRVDPQGMWESLWVRRCLGSVVDGDESTRKVDFDFDRDKTLNDASRKRIDLGKSWEIYRIPGDLM